jgi:hypothetical protein
MQISNAIVEYHDPSMILWNSLKNDALDDINLTP